MKLNVSLFTFPLLLLLTVLSFFTLLAQPVTAADSEKASTNTVYQHKTPGAHQIDETTTEIKKNEKKILIEESREMSPFFKLGIAINIVMVIIFSWWFSTQWRAKK